MNNNLKKISLKPLKLRKKIPKLKKKRLLMIKEKSVKQKKYLEIAKNAQTSTKCQNLSIKKPFKTDGF